MHIFTHWGSDTLKQEVSLLPPQPRMEGTAFLDRQKNCLVGDMIVVSEVRAHLHHWGHEAVHR